MARNLFLSLPGFFFCLLSLTINLLSYTSPVPQEVQSSSPISIKTLGPAILQAPSLGIAAVLPITTNDVWLTGSYALSDSLTVPLYEHFNGTKWTLVSSPGLGDGGAIAGLSSLSAHDIWAVGAYKTNPDYPIDLPLIEHWNGSHWSLIHQNYTNTFATASLTSVVALSANNVWMVGTQRKSLHDPSTQTFIEHWDGSQIHIVPSPNPVHTISNYLKAITANSANDLWSVGISDTGNTLIEHWNGSQWSIIASPDITFNQGIPNFNLLASVSSISKSDVWAAGLFNASATSFKGALAEHWNGSQWSIVSLQGLPGTSQELSVVVSLSANDGWALGTSTTANKASPLLVHWDGTGWRNTSLPPSFTSLRFLERMAFSSTTFVSMSKSEDDTLQLVLLQKNS